MKVATPATGEDSRQTFLVAGERIRSPSADVAQRLLAPAHAAHAARVRPMCLCTAGGVAMYIARMAPERYIIKRMPDTGMLHAPNCPSYLPPEVLSGLGQVLHGAIEESVDTGLTVLRLGFRMASKRYVPRAHRLDEGGCTRPFCTRGQHSADPASGTALPVARSRADHLVAGHDREAQLARLVSWHLRQAARGKLIKGKPLTTRLFVPEPFNAEYKAELAARRLSAWGTPPRAPAASKFMIVAGGVKTIDDARFGHKLVIKHLPDAPFMLGTDLRWRMLRRFGTELDLWQMDESLRDTVGYQPVWALSAQIRNSGP